jgi:hypothetical protein
MQYSADFVPPSPPFEAIDIGHSYDKLWTVNRGGLNEAA